jgi:cell division protein FtsW
MDNTSTRLRIALAVIVAALCGFGMVMIASSTVIGTASGRSDGTVTYAFLIKQGLAMIAGLFGALLVSRLGSRRLMDWRVVTLIFGSAVVSLLAVLAVGRSINGARRWIDLGPVNLQPAEIAKLAAVIGVAWLLGRAAERVRTFKHGLLLPVLAFGLLAGLVYATKDLGSVVVMGVVLLAMMLMAGAPWAKLCAMGATALPLIAYVAVWEVSYRRERFFAFLDPWNADGPAAYHLQQSFLAIGSGGVTGTGLGEGGAKLAFLPERHTDFIYAVICEEFGMVGGLGVATAFFALVCVGLMIAQQSRDLHRRLLATGAVVLLGTQAFWNMLVVTGAAPTKGLTLPFISYGGSSVAICLVLVGILDACARANALETAREPLVSKPIGATTTRRLTPAPMRRSTTEGA